MLLLDTSALLEGEREGVILICVIEELDRLKTKEGPVGKKARDVIKYIYRESMDNIFDETINYPQGDNTTDDMLLWVAAAENYKLVTADLSLFLRAIGRKLECDFIDGSNNQFRLTPTSTYLTDQEYSNVLMGVHQGIYPENHFLIYGSEAFRVINGIFVPVKYKKLVNSWTGEIKPRNIEQQCLIDLLLSEVPVVAVHSKYGCGKSFLMLNYVLGVVGDGKKFAKLIVIPNNAAVAQSREVGTLPGDLLEKEFVYLGPVIDLLGKEKVKEMMMKGELEVAPVAFTRGRNWDNAVVWVSESQNLTDYHVKLLLGRIGENARILFDGDVRQEDNKVFTENSGLVLLHKLSSVPESSMFGSIELKIIERSRVARLADVLDRLGE